MSACPTCGKAMLTEWPHRHDRVTPTEPGTPQVDSLADEFTPRFRERYFKPRTPQTAAGRVYPPTICKCGLAKSYHPRSDHDYEPRYEPVAWLDGYDAGRAARDADVRALRYDDPKDALQVGWNDAIAAVLAILDADTPS